CMQVLDFPWTF
nr:immunoglobulin light chain junction region [Macaca mulatta]MOX88407.1 immunoglobulin light chain junction region [Macaca mulatta]MOX90195.1 immunoglobulin light chain junction region [Macaca mulatta]MOX90361.1 immunoglobulin light chain junction region [Macaca mulatta]MOX97144.1 immunoglobulin light chain junction region [Macaca mulatta]